MVTPTYGTLTISDGRSNVAVDCYISDVDKAAVTFDSGAGAVAGGQTFYKSPMTGRIVDFSVKTGPTVIFSLRLVIDGSPIKSNLRIANHLNTLPFRPPLNIPVKVGENIGAIQSA